MDGELAGFTTYRSQPGLIAFLHTEVGDALVPEARREAFGL